MEINNNSLKIIAICIILGTILLMIGIISGEIEIKKGEELGIYDKNNYQKRKWRKMH